MNIAYLSLGSNIDKEHNLPAALCLLARRTRIVAVSAVYETSPVGNPNDPSFFNAAVALETDLTAADLRQQVLRTVEAELGRQRTTDRNAPRTIDIDIALFNDEVVQTEALRIPDPDILIHPHVALPLAEIAPNYRHPVTGETLAEIASRLSTGARLLRRDDVALQP